MTKSDIVKHYACALQNGVEDIPMELAEAVAEKQYEAVHLYALGYGYREFDDLDNFLDWLADLVRITEDA